jgi:predicted alpha/beta-hydrolase family hydrolase
VTQTVEFAKAGVHGFLHKPGRATGQGLVLTHGAGSNCDAPLLIAIAAAFSAAGLTVLRCDLPFRQQRPTGPPPRGSGDGDRAGLRAAVKALRGMVKGPVFLGGHSYGGRQASMLAAEDAGVAAGLLLLSYPLHPPKKPDQLRTGHFPQLRVPAVFVHGTSDGFGSIEEVKAAAAAIPAHAEIIPVTGAGHDLKRGRFDLQAVVAAVLQST